MIVWELFKQTEAQAVGMPTYSHPLHAAEAFARRHWRPGDSLSMTVRVRTESFAGTPGKLFDVVVNIAMVPEFEAEPAVVVGEPF